MLTEKVLVIHLIIEQIKKIYLYRISYYPEPDIQNRNKTKI